MSGPTFTINFGPEIYYKLGDISKGFKVALQDSKKLEQVVAKLEAKGQAVPREVAQRIKQLDALVDYGREKIDQRKALDDMQSASVFRQGSYNAVRRQFAEGHGVFGIADRGLNALKKGNFGGSIGALIGIQPAVMVVKQMMEALGQGIEIQNTADDYRRGSLSAPFRTRNQQMAEELKAKENVVGQIPIIGGTLKKGYEVGVGIRSFLNGEESLSRIEKRIELNELIARNPAISREANRRMAVAGAMNMGFENWAKLMNNPSPEVERLIKDIKDADKLMSDGYKAAASGNITGNLRKGGAGGAQDFFNRANQQINGIAPQNAAQTFADLEAGRISMRNFARAQMTRVYRTGD